MKIRGKKVTTLSWGMWLIAHPYGQIAMLCLFTLPIGIVAVVLSSQSFNKISDAVAQFDRILDNWNYIPVVDVAAVALSTTCASLNAATGTVSAATPAPTFANATTTTTVTYPGAGWSDYATLSWPGATAGPCACPDDGVGVGSTSYQPFNVATNTDISTLLRSTYSNPTSKSRYYDNVWKSSYCQNYPTVKGLTTQPSVTNGQCGTPPSLSPSDKCCTTSDSLPCQPSGNDNKLCDEQSCYKKNSITNTVTCYKPTPSPTPAPVPSGSGSGSGRRLLSSSTTDADFYDADFSSSRRANVACQNKKCPANTQADTCTYTTYEYDKYETQCYAIAQQSSSNAGCTEDQSHMSCKEDVSLASMSAQLIEGRKICVRRDGGTAISRPAAQGGCPTGYIQCGSGDYNSNRATCSNARNSAGALVCPIIKLQVYTGAATPTQHNIASYVGSQWSGVVPLGNPSVLAFRRSTDQSAGGAGAEAETLPITETYLGVNDEKINLGDNTRLTESTYSGNGIWAQGITGVSGSQDTRYEYFYNSLLGDYLENNFNQNQCGFSTATTTSPSGTCSSTSNPATNTACSTASITTSTNDTTLNVMNFGTNDVGSPSGRSYPVAGQYVYGVNAAAFNPSTVSADSTTYCKTSDTTCNAVMHRTLCAKYQAYSTVSKTSLASSNILMGAQPEIFYKIDADNCASKSDLNDSKSEIDKLKESLRFQMIICIVSLTGGFLIACVVIYLDFKGMDDESDEDDCIQVSAHRAAIGWAIFLQAGKLAATIIAWIAIQKAKGLFANANECTDAISASMGFADINSAVNTANDNTIGNWVLEALLLVYNIYSICTARAFNEDEVLDQAATDLAEAEAEDKESAVMEMGDNDEYKAQVESGGPI